MRRLALTVAACAALAAPAEAGAAPANDDFASAQPLAGTSATTTGTNVEATSEPGEPTHAGIEGGVSVWYVWTAPVSGRIRIQTCGSSFDTVLAVYTGSSVDALTEVAANDDSCETASSVTFEATAGTTYWIAVDGAAGDEGDIALTLAPLPPPPAPALGLYSGRTEFPDSKPISFTVLPGLARLKNLAVSSTLDCTRRGFTAGELRFRKLVFKRVSLQSQRTFAVNAKLRFKGGGSATITVKGALKPPMRATGTLNARASLPGGVRCKNFFGTVSWTARHR